MRTTCLITNYNYGRFVTDAIESALAQTRPFDEIIVVDDGSTDGSAEVVRTRFGANERVKLIGKANAGQLSSFNVGVEAASGEVVFFLDADDRYAPTCLEEVLPLYESGSADFVITGLRQFGDAERERGTKSDHDFGYTRLYAFFFEKWLGAPTSCLSCRSSLLKRFFPVPFESDWKTRADDCLAYGASLCGGRKFHLARALVNYRIHGNNNYHGRGVAPANAYSRAIAVQRFIRHAAEREGLDLSAMRHLAWREFLTKPAPNSDELRHYLRILFGSDRLSFMRKLRYAARMLRHFLKKPEQRPHRRPLPGPAT